METRGLHQVLGWVNTVAYAKNSLGMSRRTARELIKAGKRLPELPQIDAAFAQSQISWSKVRLLCEVSEPATEQEWLDCAHRCNADELAVKVRQVKRGDRPHGDKPGLPQARFDVRVKVDAIQWQMWQNARAKLRAENPGGDELTDEELLFQMLQMVLASDADGSVPGRKAIDGSIYKVVVRETEEGGAVVTEDGDEPIADATLEKVASDASVPPRLREKVLARDGHRCVCCGSMRTLHAHHVKLWSRGGKTVIENLVTLCNGCHGLVHDDFLWVGLAEWHQPDGRPGVIAEDYLGRPLPAADGVRTEDPDRDRDAGRGDERRGWRTCAPCGGREGDADHGRRQVDDQTHGLVRLQASAEAAVPRGVRPRDGTPIDVIGRAHVRPPSLPDNLIRSRPRPGRPAGPWGTRRTRRRRVGRRRPCPADAAGTGSVGAPRLASEPERPRAQQHPNLRALERAQVVANN